MSDAKERLIAIGIHVDKGCRRGRRPANVECPELKVKPNSSKWLPDFAAATILGVTCTDIFLMIKSRELYPALHQGDLFISVDSIKEKKGEDKEIPKPPPEIIEPKIVAPLIVCELSPEPQKVETKFVPIIQVLKQTTPLQIWTKPKFQVKTLSNGRFQNSALAIKLTEYAPSQFGYHVEDVATAINKNIAVPLNFISGQKVKADPTGRYITQQSLKDFFRRSRGIEIQDI